MEGVIDSLELGGSQKPLHVINDMLKLFLGITTVVINNHYIMWIIVQSTF